MDPRYLVKPPTLQNHHPHPDPAAFMEPSRPVMGPVNQLLHLRQGDCSIEDYDYQFCELSYQLPFDEIALKDIFHFGLHESVKSWFPGEEFNCSLKDFMDYALILSGSAFTVGVVEEEHDTPAVLFFQSLLPFMATASEPLHKMATQRLFTKWLPFQNLVTSQLIIQSLMSHLPESRHGQRCCF